MESPIYVPRWTPSPSPPRAPRPDDKVLEMQRAVSEEEDQGTGRSFPFSSWFKPPSLREGLTALTDGQEEVGDAVGGYTAAGRAESIFLTWKDLWVTVPDGKNGGPRPILRQLTGYAEPGEVLAIMGPSGCGKSTLLDTLSGKSVFLF